MASDTGLLFAPRGPERPQLNPGLCDRLASAGCLQHHPAAISCVRSRVLLVRLASENTSASVMGSWNLASETGLPLLVASSTTLQRHTTSERPFQARLSRWLKSASCSLRSAWGALHCRQSLVHLPLASRQLLTCAGHTACLCRPGPWTSVCQICHPAGSCRSWLHSQALCSLRAGAGAPAMLSGVEPLITCMLSHTTKHE